MPNTILSEYFLSQMFLQTLRGNNFESKDVIKNNNTLRGEGEDEIVSINKS
jgi:hypothetical protein